MIMIIGGKLVTPSPLTITEICHAQNVTLIILAYITIKYIRTHTQRTEKQNDERRGGDKNTYLDFLSFNLFLPDFWKSHLIQIKNVNKCKQCKARKTRMKRSVT